MAGSVCCKILDMVMDLLKAGALELGIKLTEVQIEQFETYFRELVNWNQKINITRITDYSEAQVKHFIDSLSICIAWKPVNKDYVLDVGAGAGFPGLPLKLAFPDFRLVLLEATAKKTVFLQHIVEKLGLRDVIVITGRAEEIAQIPEYREQFDVVLARALAELPVAVELTLPFCKTGGTFIASKKGDIKDELVQSGKAINILGGRLKEIKAVDLLEFTDERCLVIIEKVVPTPGKYPRRSGMPAKRPII